jgi:hypothetical protein
MDISSENYKKIYDYILFSVENNDYEFECIYKNNFKKLNIDKFTQIFKYFQNNPNFSLNDNSTSLDIRLSSGKINKYSNYRTTIQEKHILNYCKTNIIDPLTTDYGEKKFVDKSLGNFEPLILSNYDFLKFTLKYDTFLDDNEVIEILNSKLSKQKKNYRYKKRFSFLSKSKFFKVDLTILKSSINSLSIVEGKLLEKKPTYEIEIELNNKEIELDSSNPTNQKNKDTKIKNIIKELFSIIGNILIILDSNRFILKSNEEEDVILNYLNISNEKGANKDLSIIKKNSKKYFVGVQPKTLELENIVENSIVSVYENYCVTDKADGERFLLYVHTDKKVYLINNRLSIKYTGLTHNVINTIIDGEYVTNDKYGNSMNLYLAFDIYFLNKNNVSKYPLIKDNGKTRLNLLKDFIKTGFTKENTKNKDGLKDLEVRAKEFYSNNIFKSSKKILEKFKNLDSYKIDGLIFTPTLLPVGGLTEDDEPKIFGSWNRVFKWKPPEENTIDFLISFQGDIMVDGQLSMLCKLFVGYNENIEIDILKILNRDFEDKVYGLKEFAQCNIIYKDNKLLTSENEQIFDNTIIEFSYNPNEPDYLRWKPNRIRTDKTELYKNSGSISGTANDYTTAQNVWSSINKPVTYDLITGKEIASIEKDTKDKIENDIYYAREIDRNKSLLKPLLNFHNYHVKNLFMYDRFKGNKSLFDIACGQGGDLFKWIKADYKTVIASDINKDNLMNVRSGIYKRYNSVIRDNKNNKQKMLFLQLDASKKWNRDYIESLNDKMFRNLASIFFGFTNKSQISDSILVKYHKRINKQFDLVSCMFAIHYMFDNIDSLRNVIHNIDMILKSGGYFFGVCLDGYLVNQKFKSSKKDVIEAKVGNRLLWSIKKKYNKFNDFNQDKPLDNIGQKISVYIETINQELDEYLVDYELLKYELAKRNIFPVESNELKDIKLESVGSSTGSFEEIYKLYNKKNSIKLDKNNQEYSFLNRWFIFKKK